MFYIFRKNTCLSMDIFMDWRNWLWFYLSELNYDVPFLHCVEVDTSKNWSTPSTWDALCNVLSIKSTSIVISLLLSSNVKSQEEVAELILCVGEIVLWILNDFAVSIISTDKIKTIYLNITHFEMFCSVSLKIAEKKRSNNLTYSV